MNIFYPNEEAFFSVDIVDGQVKRKERFESGVIEISGIGFHINLTPIHILIEADDVVIKVGLKTYKIIQDKLAIYNLISAFTYKIVVVKNEKILKRHTFLGFWNIGKLFDVTYDSMDALDNDPISGFFLHGFTVDDAKEYLKNPSHKYDVLTCNIIV